MAWKIRLRLHSLVGFLCTALVICAFYYLSGDGRAPFLEDKTTRRNSFSRCNLFTGKWVYDNESSSYPLYKEGQCSFMVDDFACEKFGRKDLNYQHWRWQPNDCDLPRFNATALLQKLRGKRLVFVGDSLNKNQWISMVCLLESSIPSSLKSNTWKGSLITFEAFEYNATIDFYWEPLLVESNCDDPVNHHVLDRIVRIEAIEKHARKWTDADILVFDSFMWWLQPEMTFLWGSFESSNGIYKKIGMQLRRYEMALRTWSDWLEIHINRTKTKLFFTSLSPYHKIGEDWGSSAGQNCYNETEPILEEGYWGSSSDRGMMQVAEAAIHELERRGLKVQYLNITQLSDYRKDGHPSIYRRHWVPPTKGQLSNPRSYADCVHWCLPGVPDVWNQILYAYLMYY
ncbi:hypothetical protein ACH5RR_005170 [Cinchona calisaya]|uniref:Trichome birefringence-like N-terminal domain-containing protein n=1 Tax=Cinchona calisaya TaxID=153742 RepID=A0ABD3AKL9_9GENT